MLRIATLALTATFALIGPLDAQNASAGAIDELLRIMSDSASAQTSKVAELPPPLHGRLIALAAFDEKQGTWNPMDGPQDFGSVTADRINVLGYEIGSGGFVEARYIDFTDRRVVSYTGTTTDRRMSVNLYDDEADPDHLVLQIRIGPRRLRYLMQRPPQEEPG